MIIWKQRCRASMLWGMLLEIFFLGTVSILRGNISFHNFLGVLQMGQSSIHQCRTPFLPHRKLLALEKPRMNYRRKEKNMFLDVVTIQQARKAWRDCQDLVSQNFSLIDKRKNFLGHTLLEKKRQQ